MQAVQLGEGKRSRSIVSDGNQTEKKKFKIGTITLLLEVQQPFHCAKDKSEGGLALLWMNSLDLHIQTFSPRHIDAVVNSRIDDAWRFTGFYKAPKVANREDSWLILRHLSS